MLINLVCYYSTHLILYKWVEMVRLDKLNKGVLYMHIKGESKMDIAKQVKELYDQGYRFYSTKTGHKEYTPLTASKKAWEGNIVYIQLGDTKREELTGEII